MLDIRITQHHRFRCHAWSLIGILLACFVLLQLGFWQLRRYHYKLGIVQEVHHAAQMRPLSLHQALRRRAPNYLPLRISGHYQTQRSIWLERDLQYGHLGFDLLQPLVWNTHQPWLLVNRGWLPAVGNGRQVPALPSTSGVVQLQGHIKQWNEHVFIMGAETLNPGHWPLQIQRVNTVHLAQQMHHALYPFVLRLDVNPQLTFKRDWVALTVLPQRHLSYALQWFSFSATLLVAFVIFVIRREKLSE